MFTPPQTTKIAKRAGIRTTDTYAKALDREVQLEDGRDKHHYKLYYLLDALKLKLLFVSDFYRQLFNTCRFRLRVAYEEIHKKISIRHR